MQTGDLIAVYGTLKHAHGNHHILSYSSLISVERLGGYLMFDVGAYPIVTPSQDNESTIHIEVYEIDSKQTAAALDRLEGYPHLYNRKEVELSNNKTAWLYFMDYADDFTKRRLITEGEW